MLLTSPLKTETCAIIHGCSLRRKPAFKAVLKRVFTHTTRTGEEIAATAIEHGKEAFVRAETAAEDLLGDVKRAVSELVDQGK